MFPAIKQSFKSRNSNPGKSSRISTEKRKSFFYYGKIPSISDNTHPSSDRDNSKKRNVSLQKYTENGIPSVAEGVLRSLKRRQKEIEEKEFASVRSPKSVFSYMPKFYEKFRNKPV